MLGVETIPSEQTWHLMHPTRSQALQSKSHCVVIFANKHLEKKKDGTKRVGTTTPSPEVIHARMTSPPEIRISNLLTCAQVRLLPEEYTLSGIGESLQIHWNGETKILPEDRYLVDLDGNVTICLSDFLSKLPNKFGRRRTDGETMCSLILLPISLTCLLVCIIVFVIFPVLRSLSGKNNLILAACLFLAQLTLLIGYFVDGESAWCAVMGAFFHYFSLSMFLALAICSYHVYTIFSVMHLSVDITKETRAFAMYTCCIFSIPLVIVAVVIIVSISNSSSTSAFGYGGGPLCFLSQTTAMWLTLFLPLIVTTAVSLVLFSMTFCTLRNNADLETNATDERHVHFYFRAAVLTAITWIVGAAAFHAANSGVRIAFIVCHFLLGVYIALALICTRRVARLLSSICCCGTSRIKNHMGVMKMDSVKSTGSSASHPAVIVTSFRPKDSPRILDINEKPFFSGSNGYNTDESQA